jgi:hypothetical protein
MANRLTRLCSARRDRPGTRHLRLHMHALMADRPECGREATGPLRHNAFQPATDGGILQRRRCYESKIAGASFLGCVELRVRYATLRKQCIDRNVAGIHSV